MIKVFAVIVVIGFVQCATARPLEWSKEQAIDLYGYYKARNAEEVSKFYLRHENRQKCTNGKKQGAEFYDCTKKGKKIDFN